MELEDKHEELLLKILLNMKRLPKVLKFEELEKLNTKRLLGYLKLLQQCEESFDQSDQDVNTDLANLDTIQFKQTEKWRLAYKQVKSILKDRSHIEKSKPAISQQKK